MPPFQVSFLVSWDVCKWAYPYKNKLSPKHETSSLDFLQTSNMQIIQCLAQPSDIVFAEREILNIPRETLLFKMEKSNPAFVSIGNIHIIFLIQCPKWIEYHCQNQWKKIKIHVAS